MHSFAKRTPPLLPWLTALNEATGYTLLQQQHHQQQLQMTKPSSFMPRGGAAVTLVLTTTLLLGSVAYNNYSQVRDKAVMRAGVERDKERLRMMRQRLKDEKSAAAE